MDNELVEYGFELGYGDAFMKLAAQAPKSKAGTGKYNSAKHEIGATLGKYDPKKHGTYADYAAKMKVIQDDWAGLGSQMYEARTKLQAKRAREERARDAFDRASQRAHAADTGKKKPVGFLQRAGDALGSYARRTQGFVRNNPGKAALIGAGIAGAGYGAYRLMKKRKEEKEGIKKAAEFLYGYING